MSNIQLSVQHLESTTTVDSVSVSIRVNLSINHLLSAAYFSRSAGAIENANVDKEFGDFWEEIQTQAIATILTSVAGLEAYANELFVDHTQIFPEIRSEVMQKLWDLYELKPTIEKFEFALLLLNKPSINRSDALYQDIDVLIKLRNALTHYKPEWIDQQTAHAKLSKQLTYRASRSQYFPKSEPLFPRAWICHGTTKWAVSRISDFILYFEKQAAIPSRLAMFESRLRSL
jgi:hypothetical protein